MKQLQSELSTVSAQDASLPTQLLDDVVAGTPQATARADGIAIGTFHAIAEDGSALVSIPAFGLERIPARSISPLDASQVGQAVALGFEANDPRRPIVLGLMMASPAATPAADMEVSLDGERVVLTSLHEIELRCGEAALILSSDGRIEMRGTYITSYASATQRILGGAVNVN